VNPHFAGKGWHDARRAFELHKLGQLQEAIDGYRAALAENPKMAGAWYALGCAEVSREAFAAAIPCFRCALSLRPRWAMAELALGKARFALGEVDAALDDIRRATASRDPAIRADALAYLAIVVPGGVRETNHTILTARRKWARIESVSHPVQTEQRSRPRSRGRLRIGYLSAFFAFPNWMKPVWAAVNHHDRDAFEIHLFSDRTGPSAASGYQHHARDRIHDITPLSNEAAARFIADRRIDVLVDLNAYSYPRRLGVLMRCPAPVLVGWFNTYATSGIDAFDYVIGDHAVIPPREERFYTERVLRVAGSYLAFSVPYACPNVVSPPSLERGHLTFGCLGSQYKMTDAVVSAWSAILRRASKTRLLIKNHTLAEPSNRAAFLRRFDQRGVPASRIDLEGGGDHRAFLAAYGRIDIALDTFPYSGGTTTMEALWQGVPVLTYNGDRWASRTTRSLLLAAGLDEWCMPNRARYVARAVALAHAPETPHALAALRKSMRRRLRGSPACDGQALARELERLYVTGRSTSR
jgi:predicted O-linked N-acetylglucosamine transferase (SPINDLY family)